MDLLTGQGAQAHRMRKFLKATLESLCFSQGICAAAAERRFQMMTGSHLSWLDAAVQKNEELVPPLAPTLNFLHRAQHKSLHLALAGHVPFHNVPAGHPNNLGWLWHASSGSGMCRLYSTLLWLQMGAPWPQQPWKDNVDCTGSRWVKANEGHVAVPFPLR